MVYMPRLASKMCFISLLLMGNATAQVSLAEPNWTLAMARQAAAQVNADEAVRPLFELARAGKDRQLLAELILIEQRSDWPEPARENVLYTFAAGLAEMKAGTVGADVFNYLETYQPKTRVPHDDRETVGVPLFNIGAAAAGSANEWRRRQATDFAIGLLGQGSTTWLSSYLDARPEQRKGFEDAMAAAGPQQLSELAQSALTVMAENPALLAVVSRAGLLLADPDLLQEVVLASNEPGLARTLRAASRVLSDAESFALLEHSIHHAPAVNSAIAIAELAPMRINRSEMKELMTGLLENPELSAAAALVLEHSTQADTGKQKSRLEAGGARISEWVEFASVTDDTKIALGYPVPIPVDTPLPFQGFRSYAGLHARHQDLANTTPWVHAHAIGTTRNGRTIWAYQLGDADHETADGRREHAMLSNGGIHAREWQSPEVTTGIIELLALTEDDHHLVSYLRDNANIVVIPVLNVDGFLQTQRYPRRNWMGTDPDDPEFSPRDGRMRRKNMLGPDEDLLTQGDHLLGVDLNRNNPPYWASNPGRSSSNPDSIVHHGALAHSEPETQALVAATGLGPVDKLSMYTDLHSFSQVHFWTRNSNNRLASLTEKLLETFSGHHSAFAAGKYYAYDRSFEAPRNQGIGLTDEYFTHTYQVPSWTLEIEPSNGSHPELPGQGADYGGLGRNGHDGFILPESEVERVRTQLAESFAIAYYRQSGPPAIRRFRLVDKATGAVVFEAAWDTLDALTRQLHTFQAQPVQLGRDYSAWLAWDKPMRWRIDGEVTALPGQSTFTLNFDTDTVVNGTDLDATIGEERWLDTPGGMPDGYLRYRDDALVFDLNFLRSENNNNLLPGIVDATFEASAYDFTAYRGDANPATVARWENGGWTGYENSNGEDLTDTGGKDSTLRFQITPDTLGDPFLVDAGTSSAWFDPERNGEGFMLEILSESLAVMYWFTYDTEGNQDWYLAEGEIQGNRIVFPELMQVSGGQFGPGFDPEQVERTVVGSASFIWSSCDAGAMNWETHRPDQPRRQGRMNVLRLTQVMGIDCGRMMLRPELPAGRLSGSWYDPSHSGEGYVLEVMANQQALVYWFSFDSEGNRRWFFGTGNIVGNRLEFDEMLTTLGGQFGDSFDPEAVQLKPWGSLELELTCDQGEARFKPTEEGFPDGTLDLSRLTILSGLECGD